MKRFENKNAVVYDASHDLGPQYIQAMLMEGARVTAICSDASVFEGQQWQPFADQMSVNCYDLSSSTEGEAWKDCLPESIDVAVHNNMGSRHPNVETGEYSDDDWHYTFDCNLHSAFQFSKGVIPGLKNSSRGSMCFISTTSSYVSIVGQYMKVSAAYEAANSGLNRFSQRLAIELGESGINVNTLCAGNVAKDNLESIIQAVAATNDQTPDLIAKEILSRQVMPEFIPIADVVEQLCHLLSDASKFVTGHQMIISGGLELPK